MIYITFERRGPKFQIPPLKLSPSAQLCSKMANMKGKIFCVREFIKTESATVVQRAFRLRFNIQRWYL